jgi:hypothetical protein
MSGLLPEGTFQAEPTAPQFNSSATQQCNNLTMQQCNNPTTQQPNYPTIHFNISTIQQFMTFVLFVWFATRPDMRACIRPYHTGSYNSACVYNVA